MRIPPISSFGSVGLFACKNKTNKNSNVTVPPMEYDSVSFGTISKYVKKYSTLPDDIKETLSLSDAIDMFQTMDFIEAGLTKGEIIQEGKNATVYENPWLDDYNLIISRNANFDDIVSCEIVWCDKNAIQYLSKVCE